MVGDGPRSSDVLEDDSFALEMAIDYSHVGCLLLAPEVWGGHQVEVIRLLAPQLVGKLVNGSRAKSWHNVVLQTVVMAFNAPTSYFICYQLTTDKEKKSIYLKAHP
jgi:hypothetical protein